MTYSDPQTFEDAFRAGLTPPLARRGISTRNAARIRTGIYSAIAVIAQEKTAASERLRIARLISRNYGRLAVRAYWRSLDHSNR